jgi:ubiquinone biosynthesis protein
MTAEEATEYGIRLRAALEEAGGVFVKLGQLLATRPDVIPQETADELAELHQDVAPAPPSEVESELSAAFGQPLDQIFTDFGTDCRSYGLGARP